MLWSITYIFYTTGYASQHNWCLSQARIKWKGCGRKGILHKNLGDDGGGLLISPDGVAPSHMVGVSLPRYLPLHDKSPEEVFSGTGSPKWSQENGRKTRVCVCVWYGENTV